MARSFDFRAEAYDHRSALADARYEQQLDAASEALTRAADDGGAAQMEADAAAGMYDETGVTR